jgi:hypothetical protein
MTTQTTLNGWNEYVAAKRVLESLRKKMVNFMATESDKVGYFFYYDITKQYETDNEINTTNNG